MVVIKGQERKLKKPINIAKAKMSEKAMKKLKRPQDNQPIPTVCV
jgi:hypothetical protein